MRFSGTGPQENLIYPMRATFAVTGGWIASRPLKVFPDQAAVIENSWSGWTQTDVYDGNDRTWPGRTRMSKPGASSTTIT